MEIGKKSFSNQGDSPKKLCVASDGFNSSVIHSIKNNRVTIIEGETTKIPQILVSANITEKKIACTQARRIEAVLLATQTAKELGATLGSSVGYEIRFDSKISPDTRLIYMTDGSFLRKIEENPSIPEFEIILIDKVYERSVNSDIGAHQ